VTGMRPPVVAGVGGGVGTTTVAVALRGRDAGRAAASADILTCRGTLDSLRRAAAVLDQAGPGPRPVLAVTLDGPRSPRGPVRARLQLLEPAVSAVVLLPHVRSWPTVADPLPEVAGLLVQPADRVPRPLRAYAAALRELAAAVASSDRLQASAQPTRGARVRAAATTAGRPQGAHRSTGARRSEASATPSDRPGAYPPDMPRGALSSAAAGWPGDRTWPPSSSCGPPAVGHARAPLGSTPAPAQTAEAVLLGRLAGAQRVGDGDAAPRVIGVFRPVVAAASRPGPAPLDAPPAGGPPHPDPSPVCTPPAVAPDVRGTRRRGVRIVPPARPGTATLDGDDAVRSAPVRPVTGAAGERRAGADAGGVDRIEQVG
jgi:hypothetical protein